MLHGHSQDLLKVPRSCLDGYVTYRAGADESVSTFGLWDIKPNFYNAVPRSVRVDIDIRDSDKERRDSIITQTLDGAEAIAAQRKCGHTAEIKFEYPVATSDKKVRFRMLTRLCHLPKRVSFRADAATSALAYHAWDYRCIISHRRHLSRLLAYRLRISERS